MLLHLPHHDKRTPSSLRLLQNTRSSSSLLWHDAPMGHIQPTRCGSATGNLRSRPCFQATLWSTACFSPHRQPKEQPLHDGG